MLLGHGERISPTRVGPLTKSVPTALAGPPRPLAVIVAAPCAGLARRCQIDRPLAFPARPEVLGVGNSQSPAYREEASQDDRETSV